MTMTNRDVLDKRAFALERTNVGRIAPLSTTSHERS